VQHVVAVALRGVRACPLMKNGLDILDLPLGDALAKIVLVQVIGDFSVHQIQELVALGQIVDHQDIGMAAPVQAAHDIAADEAGASGYYNHDSSPAVTTDVPSFPTTTPPARLAHDTASNHDSPAARVTARAASTVSPAPETSKTSWAC